MNEIITEKNYPVQKVWIMKSILGSILSLIILVPLYLSLLSGSSQSSSQNSETSIYLIIILGFVPFRLITAILRRATFHYSIENDFLTLRQGILSRQQRHIPYGVIQNLFVKQDLFDRVFGLASLTVENASQGAGSLATPQGQKVFGMKVSNRGQQPMEMVGFSGNKVSIPGLTKINAELLKEIVLQKMKENPIEDSQSGL